MYKETIEYGLLNKNTKEVVNICESEYEANKMRSRGADPNHWIVVKRVVIKFEWEEIE